MHPTLYEELTFSWKRKIVQIFLEHTIHEEMILNFDQSPVGFSSTNKTSYTDKGSESVLITNVDDKCQVTATFCFSLPRQLMYGGLTDRCHPIVEFLNSFHIIHSSYQGQIIGLFS